MKSRIAATGIASLLGILLALAPLGAATASDPAKTIARELTKYAESFRTLYFIHLRGPDDVHLLRALPEFLGEGASNVDYEHGPESRELLIKAQTQRIALMLRSRQPSATLFATGPRSPAGKPYVCVITLDERFLGISSHAATAFMLGENRRHEVSRVRVQARLDGTAFIRFVVHHEVFHCLDVFLHGSSHPRGLSEEHASYHRFRSEFRADLFAALAHRRAAPDEVGFLRAIIAFRQLTLGDHDSSHLTASAVRTALSVADSELASLSLNALVHDAADRADHALPTRKEYFDLVAAVSQIMPTEAAAGREPDVRTRLDAEKVAELERNFSSAHRLIFGHAH